MTDSYTACATFTPLENKVLVSECDCAVFCCKAETNKVTHLIFNDDMFCMYAQIWLISSFVSPLWPNEDIKPCPRQLLFARISAIHDVKMAWNLPVSC